MKQRILSSLVFMLALTIFACSKEKNHNSADQKSPLPEETAANANRNDNGAIQLSGTGYFDAADECNAAGQGASFSLTMTGDLTGCLYIFVDEFECSPSGTYRELGREKFVGTYKGLGGTFWTTYRFEAKYEGCAENGSYEGIEVLGRCQHPLVAGSGTGVFAGVSGRLDLKDDMEAGNYPYRGHLRF